MSNRTLLIGGALFVAVFVLVALALMPKEAPTEPVEELPKIAEPPPRALPVLVDAGSVALPVAVGSVDAGVEVKSGPPVFELTEIKGEPSLTREQLGPAVAAVKRIVAQCSADVAARYRGTHEVTLSFEVRGDGEFATLVLPEVEKSSLQDPFFEACVKDAPLDVQVPLAAVGSARVRLPFRSDRSGE